MTSEDLQKAFTNPMDTFGFSEALLLYRGILPVLESLGWKRFKRIITEFQIPTFAIGTENQASVAVDVVCCDYSGVYFVLEAKRWAKPWEQKDFEQIKKYCNALRPPVGILSNGVEWLVYVGSDYDTPQVTLSGLDVSKLVQLLEEYISPNLMKASPFPYNDALRMGMSNNRNRTQVTKPLYPRERSIGLTPQMMNEMDGNIEEFNAKLDSIVDEFSPDILVSHGGSSLMFKIQVADSKSAAIFEYQPEKPRLAFRGHELTTKLGFTDDELEAYENSTRALNSDFTSTHHQDQFLEELRLLIIKGLKRVGAQ